MKKLLLIVAVAALLVGAHTLHYGFQTACTNSGECFATGCSGQVCASEEVFTTCEYQSWYECLQYAVCKCEDGDCAWHGGHKWYRCLADHGITL